jgi:hypothetical protein
MYLRNIIAAGMIGLAASASQAEQAAVDPPEFDLAVSPPFTTSGKVERYRAGETTLDSPPYRTITTAAVSEQSGDLGPRAEKPPRLHWWSVKVYATFSKKVAAAYASTKNGYQLGMTAGTELETPDEGSYMVARLRRKQFRWGTAVSFLSQFTQDSFLATPENGRLVYEVWGVTADRKYTVVATASVRHPKLPNLEDGPDTRRSFRAIEAVKRDPDYKRIERCKAEEFTPSLTAFDEMLDSLTIR